MRSDVLRLGLSSGAIMLALSCGRSTIDFGVPPEGSAGMGGGSAGVGGTSSGGTSSGGNAGVAGIGGSAGIGGGSCVADTECQACTCDSCPGVWADCQAATGCSAITECGDKNGCVGLDCYNGPCQQVIDQNGGPFGLATNVAEQVGACRQAEGCPCPTSGTGGTGGSGTGGITGSGGSNTGGSGGTGPLACVSCIQNQCPGVAQCLFSQPCRDGAICAVQTCLGGGGLNFQCLLGCFNGNIQAGLQAFQALQCFVANCSQTCGGVIPGLPGGGGGGPSTPPNPGGGTPPNPGSEAPPPTP